MKKIAIAIAAVAAVVGLGAAPAAAAGDPYTGDEFQVAASSTTVTAGAEFTAVATDCEPGGTVAFAIAGSAATGACTGSAGAFRPLAAAGTTASATLTAPAVPGQYELTATDSVDGDVASTTITVVAAGGAGEQPAGELPATGTGIADLAGVAALALVAGAILFVAAYSLRRRSTGAA